jgi:hypothetical protein
MPQFLSGTDCTGIHLGFLIYLQEKKIQRTEFRFVCSLRNWSFTSAINPVSEIIFGYPLTHFLAVMLGSTVGFELNVKKRNE